MPNLAGADDAKAAFDICELVSLLTIPHFKKVAMEDDDDADKFHFFSKILDMILIDVFGTTNGVPLNHETVKTILEEYGETEISPQLVDEMVDVANGLEGKSDAKLDVHALVGATSNDLDQYDPDWTHQNATHYADVFENTNAATATGKNLNDEESATDDKKTIMNRIMTMSSIDYVAENYSSKFFVINLWVLIIVAYFAYLNGTSGLTFTCSASLSNFGCKVVRAIITWIFIFLQLR